MTAEAAIYARLAADAGVLALIGNGDSPATIRGWFGVAPENTTAPYVTWQRVSGLVDNGLGGATGGFAARVQVDCWATDAAGAQAVADAVTAALAGFSGTAGSTTVRHMIRIEESTDYEEPTRLYRVRQEWSVRTDS